MPTRTFSVNGEIYDIPENETKGFLQQFPSAERVNTYSVNGALYDIPLSQTQGFLKDNKGAKPVATVDKDVSKAQQQFQQVQQSLSPQLGAVGAFTPPTPAQVKPQPNKPVSTVKAQPVPIGEEYLFGGGVGEAPPVQEQIPTEPLANQVYTNPLTGNKVNPLSGKVMKTVPTIDSKYDEKYKTLKQKAQAFGEGSEAKNMNKIWNEEERAAYLLGDLDKNIYDTQKTVDELEAEIGELGKYNVGGTSFQDVQEYKVSELKKAKQALADAYKKRNTGIDRRLQGLKEQYLNGDMEQAEYAKEKARLEGLKEDVFKTPDQITQKAYNENKADIQDLVQREIVPKDATPQEALKIYSNVLFDIAMDISNEMGYDQTERGLERVITEDIPYAAQRFGDMFTGKSQREEQYDEIINKLRDLAPVVYLNKLPKQKTVLGQEVVQDILAPAAKGFQKGLDIGTTSTEKAQNIAGAIKELGIEEQASEAAKEKLKTVGDLTTWDEFKSTLGTTLGLMGQFAIGGGVAEKVLQGNKYWSAIKTLKETGQLANVSSKAAQILNKTPSLGRVFGAAAESAVTYGTTGLVFDQPEASVESGLLGGAGGSAATQVLGKVAGVFGTAAPKFFQVMMNTIGRAGGEVTEEAIQELVSTIKDVDTEKNFWRNTYDVFTDSEKGAEFEKLIQAKFPDSGSVAKFIAFTAIMGAGMGLPSAYGDVYKLAERLGGAEADAQQAEKIVNQAEADVVEATTQAVTEVSEQPTEQPTEVVAEAEVIAPRQGVPSEVGAPPSTGVVNEGLRTESPYPDAGVGEIPSYEQQLSDVQSGNVATFTYNSVSEVPEIFKDKISSIGETNGRAEVRVTVAKSLADYAITPPSEAVGQEVPPIVEGEGVQQAEQPAEIVAQEATPTPTGEGGKPEAETALPSVEEAAKALGGVKFSAKFNLPLEQTETPKQVAEAYHKAKADGSNPPLVKAVEELLGTKQPTTEVSDKQQVSQNKERKQQNKEQDAKVGRRGLVDVGDINVGDIISLDVGEKYIAMPMSVSEIINKDGFIIFKGIDTTTNNKTQIKFRNTSKVLIFNKTEQDAKRNESTSVRGQSEPKQAEGTGDSDMPIVNEAGIPKREATQQSPPQKGGEGEIKPQATRLAKAGEGFDELMSILGVKKNLTPEEQQKALPAIIKIAEGLAEEFGYQGQKLITEVKKYLKERGVTNLAPLIDKNKDKIAPAPKGEGKEQVPPQTPKGVRTDGGGVKTPPVSPSTEEGGGKGKARYGVRMRISGLPKEVTDIVGQEYTLDNFKTINAKADGIMEEVLGQDNVAQAIEDAFEETIAINMTSKENVDNKTLAMVTTVLLDKLAANALQLGEIELATNIYKYNKARSTALGGAISALQEAASPESLINNVLLADETVRQELLNHTDESGKRVQDIIKELQEKLTATESEMQKALEQAKVLQEQNKAAQAEQVVPTRSVNPKKQEALKQISDAKKRLKEYFDKMQIVGLAARPQKPDFELLAIAKDIALGYIKLGYYSIPKLRGLLKKDIGADYFDEIYDQDVQDAIKSGKIDAMKDNVVNILKKEPKTQKKDITSVIARAMAAKAKEIAPTDKKARNVAETVKTLLENEQEARAMWTEAVSEAKRYYEGQNIPQEQKDAIIQQLEDSLNNFVPISNSILREQIRAGVKDLGTTMREIASDHYTNPSKVRENLVDKLVAQTGIPRSQAQSYAEAVANTFDEMYGEAKRAKLNEILGLKKDGTPRKKGESHKKTTEDNIINAIISGALDNETALEIMAERYGFNVRSANDAMVYKQLAELIKGTEGELKNRLLREFANKVMADRKWTPYKTFKTITDLMYHKALMGVLTTTYNIPIGSTFAAITNTLPMLVLNPKASVEAAKAYKEAGLSGTGRKALIATLNDGFSNIQNYISESNANEKGSLIQHYMNKQWDANKFGGRLGSIWAFINKLGNMAAAWDNIINYRGGEWINFVKEYNRLLDAGLKTDSPEFMETLKKNMGYDKETIDRITEQVDNEIRSYAGNLPYDYRTRRIRELMFDSRDKELMQAAYSEIKKAGFMEAPEGVLGRGLENIQGWGSYKEDMGWLSGGGKFMMQTLTFFLRISVAMMNAALEGIPILGLSSLVTHAKKDVNGKKDWGWQLAKPQDRVRIIILNTIATTMAAFALTHMFKLEDDDDGEGKRIVMNPNRRIDITGEAGEYYELEKLADGTEKRVKKYKPFSFRFRKKNGEWGDWVSVKFVPFLWGTVSGVGSLRDKIEIESGENRIIFKDSDAMSQFYFDAVMGLQAMNFDNIVSFGENLAKAASYRRFGLNKDEIRKERWSLAKKELFNQFISRPLGTVTSPFGNLGKDVRTIIENKADIPKKVQPKILNDIFWTSVIAPLYRDNNRVDNFGYKLYSERALMEMGVLDWTMDTESRFTQPEYRVFMNKNVMYENPGVGKFVKFDGDDRISELTKDEQSWMNGKMAIDFGTEIHKLATKNVIMDDYEYDGKQVIKRSSESKLMKSLTQEQKDALMAKTIHQLSKAELLFLTERLSEKIYEKNKAELSKDKLKKLVKEQPIEGRDYPRQ